MSAAVDILSPQKRVAIVASNPAVSKQTGWPIGFWWSELAHPYREFFEHGYVVDIYSPDGGTLQVDTWSDPRDESKYSSHDLISLGSLSSPEHSKIVESTKPISQLEVADYDAILFVGGQAPMYTYYNDVRVEAFSDGVFGFAIAPLVLGVQVPSLRTVTDAELRFALLQALSQPVPYVTSFAAIGII